MYLEESELYSAYPWLCEAAEFRYCAGKHVLQIGCGTGRDVLQFVGYSAIPIGIDITNRHLELAANRLEGRRN